MANFNRSDAECAAFLRQKLPHYHKIRLNDNIETPGRVNRNKEFKHIGFPEDFFKGKRVLDIGGLDGVMALNAEFDGAQNNLIIDVEDFEDYDWGWDGPATNLSGLGNTKNRVFPALKEFFSSTTDRKKKTVYDLSPSEDGMFDIVFFYGVLYHLRHPLLSFDSLRKVCSDTVCVETHVCNDRKMLPSSIFYLDDVLANAVTNWTGPSESCVVHWMKDAGFKHVYIESQRRMASRQRFIGFTGEASFEPAESFEYCDEQYFRKTREEVEYALSIGAKGIREGH